MGSATVQGIFSVIEALNLAIKLFFMERELNVKGVLRLIVFIFSKKAPRQSW
jgi:hypothetical protein